MAERKEVGAQLKRLERVFQQFEKFKGNNEARRELIEISNLSPDTFQAAYLAYKEGRSLTDYNFIDALVQGVTMGFGDELKAWFQTLGQGDEEYTQRLGEIRAAKQIYEAENPMTAFAGEMVGSVATLATPMGLPAKLAGGAAKTLFPALRSAKAAPVVPTTAGQTIRSGVAGGVEGFVGGAGRAEGDFADRARAGALETAFGAGIGGATPAAIGGATSLYQNLLRDPKTLEAQKIASRLGVRGIDEVSERVSERARTGDVRPETIADIAGESAQRQVRGARAAEPEFGQEAKEFLKERSIGSRGRVMEDIETAAGIDQKNVLDIQEIVDEMTRRGDAEYSALRSEYTQTSLAPFRSNLRSPAVRDAYKETVDDMMNRYSLGELTEDQIKGMPMTYDEFIKLLDANPDMNAPFAFLETLAGKIGDDIAEAKQRGRGRLKSSLTSAKEGLQSKMDEIFVGNKDKGVPSYAEVRAKYADSARIADAYDEGLKFNRMTPAQVRKFLETKGDAERQAFRQAAVEGLRNRFSREGRNIAEALRGDALEREKLEALSGSKEAYENLMESLRRESEMMSGSNLMTGGSVTAEKLEDISDFDGISRFSGEVERYGLPFATGRRVADELLRPIRATDVNIGAARQMLETDPIKQLQTMSAVKMARPSQQFREGALEFGGLLGRGIATGSQIEDNPAGVTVYTRDQSRRLGLLD
jgi:hypothetical protein